MAKKPFLKLRRLYGMACDNERYENSSNLGKIERNHARNPEYPENQERGA